MTEAGDRFLGYPRPDGRFGVRNHVLVLSVAGLTGPAARRIVSMVRGAVAVATPFGPGLIGADAETHRRALLGFGRNPNVGAVLVIGGEPPMVDAMADDLSASGKPVAALTLDDCGHDALALTDRGARIAAGLVRDLSRLRRQPAPAAALMLGVECGRSDPSSGLVSNPLIGLMADRLGREGGTVIAGETVEWLGAEHLLARRAASQSVADALLAAVGRRERAAVEAGIDLTGNNPGPTNIAAGLSSIEEKSLGAIAKTGTRPIDGVVAYAEPPPGPGLYLMDQPAYAPESLSGFVAAGATVLLFSTGVGNSYVSALAPTLKISANPETCARLGQQLDFAAAAVFSGRESLENAADRLWPQVLGVASGDATWGELLYEGDEIVSRFGAAL
ncbi:MAG: UxaA family hydrolase [Inquilinaceae bacterium]